MYLTIQRFNDSTIQRFQPFNSFNLFKFTNVPLCHPPPSKVLLLALLVTAGSVAKLRAQEPANNDFANRSSLTGTNILLSASNTGATKEPGEPNHWGRIGGSSVWWTWRAPTNGQAQISTHRTSFHTVLAGYVGTMVSNLS